MEFQIQFTDVTLLECNGMYDDVCKLVEKEYSKSGVAPAKNEWMLRSTVSIMSMFGYCQFMCHFYSNGKVFVADYSPSSKDIHNTDLRCLTYWCNESGWKTPEPLPSVVQSWLPFWKKEWETHIVDSSYLDKRFGNRRDMEFADDKDVKYDFDDEEDL
jgi:hypothetical protein